MLSCPEVFDDFSDFVRGWTVLFLISTLTLGRALGAVLMGKVRSRCIAPPCPWASWLAPPPPQLQSSTLVSVVLLGLVEAGAMGTGPGLAAILANVGTTVTAGLACARLCWAGPRWLQAS